VAEICHRLDGLPLAIELAAARLRLLPPQALLDRLEYRLPVLTGGARDAPARQQTLRQTIAWSHDLLTPAEQGLFRRLAVFSGGFDLRTAESVANLDAAVDIFAGLSALVDHSLVQQVEGVGDEPRFIMLETIREFGLERLTELDNEAAVRDAHAAFFLASAHLTETHPDHRRNLAWHDSERPNLRAALTYLAGCGDTVRLLELASIISGPWTHFGYAEEARGWLERGLAAGDAIVPRLRRRALSGLAAVLFQLRGEPVEALACGEEALTLARGEDDWASIAKAAHWAGLSALWLDQPQHSEALFQESRAALLHFPAGDAIKREFAHLDNLLGQAALAQGDIAYAEQLFASARDIERAMEQELGVYPPLSYPLIGLGHVARCRGDAATALAHYQEGLAIGAQFGDVRAITLALAGVAGALAALGRWREAATQFGATEALCDRVGISFAMRPFAWQTAVGLPHPWQTLGASFAWAQALRAATASATSSLPPLADPILAEALWADGRALSLEDAVALALASDPTLPSEPRISG
jgi:tetratricopeptide (TPR) repeat protein